MIQYLALLEKPIRRAGCRTREYEDTQILEKDDALAHAGSRESPNQSSMISFCVSLR